MHSRKELSHKIIEKVELLVRCTQLTPGSDSHSYPFSDLNLSRRQIFFLLIIAKTSEGISVKDLAEFSGVTPGAITQLIDSLIEKGLVIREESLHDRRVTKIKLSEMAKNKLDMFKVGYFDPLSTLFDDFTNEELNTLYNLLSKIKK